MKDNQMGNLLFDKTSLSSLDNWILNADEYLLKIYTTRRANLDALAKFYGGVAALGRITEYSADTLRHLRYRPFTEKTARRIEMNLGLEYGWMDVPHGKKLFGDE